MAGTSISGTKVVKQFTRYPCQPSGVYMLNLIAADLVVLLHFAFIVFVVAGGLLALKWRWLPWFHVPAAIWGAVIEFSGWVCPLTPIENMLRVAGGGGVYVNSFIAHYIVPVIYPSGLKRSTQVVLGFIVVAINAVVYGAIFLQRQRKMGADAKSKEK